ncbi:alkanesulfonate monooxygenase [Sphingomonas zeicaulis]|uniref:LLM class flavin-dependent oxidoreductase n=1 Tax=Sphingomonas zeicaulis TaxID=1632740 RepID=UPI003D1C6A22
MPVEFVGALAARDQLRGPIGLGAGGTLDLDFLRDLARAHEHADFDRVLMLAGGESVVATGYAASVTERLGFMIPYRPGLTTPAHGAKTLAALDHVTRGRIRVHAITGITAEPGNGNTITDKDARYARTSEYLEVLRRAWTEDRPFDFDGQFYQLRNVFSPVKPLQKPHIPISFGGSSDAAYHVAVRHTDLYALWAEPLTDVAEQIGKLRAAAAAIGAPVPRVSLSVRLIIGKTEEQAWERAHAIAAALTDHRRNAAPSPVAHHGLQGTGTKRLLAAAERGERHDRALWMGTATAVGGTHDSTSLVGTPDTIVAALLDYYDIGVTTFLNRGYEPLYDAIDYGRWIIPAVRAAVKGREAEAERKFREQQHATERLLAAGVSTSLFQ